MSRVLVGVDITHNASLGWKVVCTWRDGDGIKVIDEQMIYDKDEMERYVTTLKSFMEEPFVY